MRLNWSKFLSIKFHHSARLIDVASGQAEPMTSTSLTLRRQKFVSEYVETGSSCLRPARKHPRHSRPAEHYAWTRPCPGVATRKRYTESRDRAATGAKPRQRCPEGKREGVRHCIYALPLLPEALPVQFFVIFLVAVHTFGYRCPRSVYRE